MERSGEGVGDGSPTPPKGRTFGHLPALDGLRGLAVAAVLVFHGGRLRGGYLGVDAFFVLSGFLITSLLLVEAHRNGRIGLRAFWGRRIKRLVPALVLFMLGIAAYAVVVAEPGELARIRGDALATIGYVANWNAIFRQHGYWELFSQPSPLEHTWSLAIEEQFYVVWPLVVAGLVWWSARRGRDAAGSVLKLSLVLAAASAGLLWLLYEPGGDTGRVYLGTDTRAAAILLGAAFAAWRWMRGAGRAGWTVRRVGLEVAAVAAAVGLAFAWTGLDGQDPNLYRGGLLACGLAVVVVIAAAGHAQPGPLARVLGFAPLRWLGLISYGLYLWHWPVYLFLDAERTGLEGWPLLGMQVVASVAVAVLSYHALEQPIRLGRIRWVRMTTAVPAGALACVVAVVVATSGQTGAGSSVAVSQSSRTVEERGLTGPPATGDRADGGRGTRLLIVGDSVAASLAAGAQALPDRGPFVVGDGSVNGCALTAAVTGLQFTGERDVFEVDLSRPCDQAWAEAYGLFRPDVVVVVYGNAGGFERFELEGSWVGPCDPSYRAWYLAELSRIVGQFQAGGSVVSLAKLAYPDSEGLPADVRTRIDCMNLMNLAVASTVRADVIDLGALVCPGGTCIREVQGSPLRADGVHFGEAYDNGRQHFRGAGAEFAASWLLATLERKLDPASPG